MLRVTSIVEYLPNNFEHIPAKTMFCVFDVGPTLYKCYANVLCLLGRLYFRIIEKLTISPCFTQHPGRQRTHTPSSRQAWLSPSHSLAVRATSGAVAVTAPRWRARKPQKAGTGAGVART